MAKVKNFGRKNFFGRNRFRMVWNVFETENLEIFGRTVEIKLAPKANLAPVYVPGLLRVTRFTGLKRKFLVDFFVRNQCRIFWKMFKCFLNHWNASRLVGQARKPELGLAFGASLISIVRPKIFDCHFSLFLPFWPQNDRVPKN